MATNYNWRSLIWYSNEGRLQRIKYEQLYASYFVQLRCNIHIASLDLINDDAYNCSLRLEQNDSKLYKIQRSMLFGKFTKQKLKDLQNWFKHAIAILKNYNLQFDLTILQNEFSKLTREMLDYYYDFHPNKIQKEELIKKLYKPSRIQYIIDNFGIDALDNY